MVKIHVYLDDGRVFSYRVSSASSAREHVNAIVKSGYRSCKKGVLEHYPSHRIVKVKAVGKDITTRYPDTVTGT